MSVNGKWMHSTFQASAGLPSSWQQERAWNMDCQYKIWKNEEDECHKHALAVFGQALIQVSTHVLKSSQLYPHFELG